MSISCLGWSGILRRRAVYHCSRAGGVLQGSGKIGVHALWRMDSRDIRNYAVRSRSSSCQALDGSKKDMRPIWPDDSVVGEPLWRDFKPERFLARARSPYCHTTPQSIPVRRLDPRRFHFLADLGGGRHGTQEARGSSGYPGFVAPNGLCIGSLASALFKSTVVRHASEWVRSPESNPTLADLCRSHGRSWR